MLYPASLRGGRPCRPAGTCPALTQTLWYLQAHLADLAAEPESLGFRTCQRVYNRCQRILFEDPEPEAQVPRQQLLRFLPVFEAQRKVYPDNTASAFVGLASSLLAIGSPSVSQYGGAMAAQQGRKPPDGVRLESAVVNEARGPAPAPALEPAVPTVPPVEPVATSENVASSAPDLAEQVFGLDDDRPRPAPTETPPAAPMSSPAPSAPPAALTPRTHSYALLQKYLCSHYGRTAMQFLQALQDIPVRLQPLPKPARLSALRAELTALNRTLPAEVCFPTWCHGTAMDEPRQERHHRVVRISASEAVVLNSADRVPYLLHVEVLRNDLDFDPNRRYNRELLQRIFDRDKRACQPLVMADVRRMSVPQDPLESSQSAQSATPAPALSGEVDLTEQMYGSDLGGFGREHDPEEGLGHKNDTLDTAVWAHASAAGEPSQFSLEEYAQRMRTAAVMLAQLNKGGGTPRAGATEQGEVAEASGARVSFADAQRIRQRIMDEMAALEEQRMDRMKRGGQYFSRRRQDTMAAEDESAVLKAVNKDDPSAAYFRESWTVKKERIRASSPYGRLPTWDLFSVIVKTGADLRQEQFAVQLINEFRRIWNHGGSRCWVHYFRIVVLNENAGLIETIKDAISIHSIKKDAYARQLDGQAISAYSLYDYFVQTYGEPHTVRFRRARRHFLESLAGYAIVSYLLQTKDRHNGNILVDSEGHLIHIDFGFILGLSPGGVGFEAAPFKFPRDYIDILGGMDSEGYHEFRSLMQQGFRDIRKHAERFILLVELMQRDSHLPCFVLNDQAAAQLRDRFQLGLTATQCDEFVDRLILSAAGSAFTRLYDQYQNFTQNIL